MYIRRRTLRMTDSARLFQTGDSQADSLIAGHALALGLVLVTHKTKEFSRVAGLEVEDWV